MKRTLLALALSALAAADADAATVTARTQLDGGGVQVVSDSVSATSARLGIPGFDDLGIDEAFASADLVTGELRFRARDGVQTGSGPGSSGAFAAASLQETLSFRLRPGTSPVILPIEVGFTSVAQLFEDTFPLFNQPPSAGIGGFSQLGSIARLSILEQRPIPNADPITLRSFGALEQTVSGLVLGRASGPDPELRNVAVNERGFGFINDTFPSQPSEVVDIRTEITASAPTVFEGTIFIDILLTSAITFDILFESSGTANGGFGTYTGVSSLNTAVISIDLPEGVIFESGSGLFLSGAGGGGPAVVPAPPGLPLLLGGLAAFAALRARRRG